MLASIVVHKLRILDRGDGEPYVPLVPTMPDCRYNSPCDIIQKRARDEAADVTFENFGATLSSPTPSLTNRRRNGGSQLFYTP
ncbi:hypothetical protein B0H14DRAFT_3465670 [Mycena olivaceomarginata]|nr:hypothetical protein B0H14DRAFT_3465670 [Mycena olivaceomarginata]